MSLTFGLLAGLLSVGLSILAWFVVSANLVSEAKSNAVMEAVLDRDAVQAAVEHGREAVAKALPLKVRSGQSALALVGGQWLSSAPGFGPEQLPANLRPRPGSVDGDVQRMTLDGSPYFVVRLPLQPSGNVFYEWIPEGALGAMLRELAVGLAASALAMTIIGLLLGRAATRLALRPLAVFGRVAGRVAHGDLSARLPIDNDPDLRELATSFNATIDELQRRVAMESRFALDVSHELRTPLTTMLNSVEVIQNRRETLPRAVREPLDMLTADVQRFRSLVVDLLEFSRDDAGDRLVLEEVVIADRPRAPTATTWTTTPRTPPPGGPSPWWTLQPRASSSPSRSVGWNVLWPTSSATPRPMEPVAPRCASRGGMGWCRFSSTTLGRACRRASDVASSTVSPEATAAEGWWDLPTASLDPALGLPSSSAT